MTTKPCHEPPRALAVFRLQLTRIGRSLRPELIGLAVVLSPIVIMALALLMDRDAALDYPTELDVIIPVGAFLLPFRLWSSERLFDLGGFQQLPFERRKHVLVRVCAGAVWALGLAATVVILFDLLARVAGSATIGATWQWLVPLGSAATAYLLGSAVVLALRHPVRWSIGLILAFVMLTTFGLGGPLTTLTRAILYSDLGLTHVLTGGTSIAAWIVALLFWFGLGLTAVALASLRHREG